MVTGLEESIHMQLDKWFVLDEEMIITEIAIKMGARSAEHLTYIKQYPPFEEQETHEVKRIEDTLKQNTAVPWIFRQSQDVTPDTNSEGNPSMGVGTILDIIKQVIDHWETDSV